MLIDIKNKIYSHMDFNISQRAAIKQWIVENIDTLNEAVVFIKAGKDYKILDEAINKLQRQI